MYQAFASLDETTALRQAFADGIAWGDAKQLLFERIDAEVTPMRARYEALIANPSNIEQQLRDGAQRVRGRHATPLLSELRSAVGLRALDAQTTANTSARGAKTALPIFKQYRDADGRFYFKLHAGDGRLLVQSSGFESPKDAGQLIARLKSECGLLQDKAEAGLHLGEVLIGKLAEAVIVDEVVEALEMLIVEAGDV